MSPVVPGTFAGGTSPLLHTQRLAYARRWVESFSRRSRHEYPQHLGGLCAISAAHLYQELLYAGFDAQIAVADKRLDRENYSVHAFVLSNYQVLDVTATQFGQEAQVELPLAQASRQWFWRPARTFRDVQRFRAWQMAEGWPLAQTVPPHLASRWSLCEPYRGHRIAA